MRKDESSKDKQTAGRKCWEGGRNGEIVSPLEILLLLSLTYIYQLYILFDFVTLDSILEPGFSMLTLTELE